MINFNAQLIAALAPFVSTEEARYYLKGIHFTGKLAVATDGKAMGVAHDNVAKVAENIILPMDKTIIAAAKKKNAARFIYEDGIAKVIDVSESVLAMAPCAPIDATFLDWRRIIPQTEERVSGASFGAMELDRLIKCAKVFGKNVPMSIYGSSQNDPHIVRFSDRDDFFAVQMPMRGETSYNLPAWLND